MMFEGGRSNARVLKSFLVRDLIAQFGRHNIGFLWAILEPMILCAGVATIWYLVKPPFYHGVPIVAFVVTGYMPLTLFRHLTGPSARLFRRSVGLLVHRQLGLLDIFLSRMTLEFAGSTMAFAVIYLTLYFAGAAEMVHDYRLVVWGWLLLTWLCVGLAACIAAATELSEAVGHFVQPVQYLSIPLSPTFYMVDWLPLTAQQLLYWNPLTHPYEMIRAGFFGPAVHAIYDPIVTTVGGLLLLAIGIPGIAAVRERLHDA
jgi:capsular polysaccharide transport system permease protein